MSVRRFAGYFLVLAACATIAFSTSDGASEAETLYTPMSAAGFMPGFSAYPAGSFSVHHPKFVRQRTQMAQAQ